jgi:hypothetical protein
MRDRFEIYLVLHVIIYSSVLVLSSILYELFILLTAPALLLFLEGEDSVSELQHLMLFVLFYSSVFE